MKMSKVIMPLVATTIIGYVVKKRGFSMGSSSAVSDIAQAASDATIETFGGLKQSEINEIASNTYRGVKAVIDGDTLEYCFKSASGKQTPTARIELDAAGELVFTFLSYFDAKSPHLFKENLRDAMNKVN